jgi:hypothetical protein
MQTSNPKYAVMYMIKLRFEANNYFTVDYLNSKRTNFQATF